MSKQNVKQKELKKTVNINIELKKNGSQQSQFKQFIKNNEEDQSQECKLSEVQSAPLNCLICFLCEDTILSAVQCICGHAFCQQCLNHYLTKRKQCPICDTKIRGRKGSGNKRLDEFIQDFCTFVGGNLADNLKKRKYERKKILDGQKLDNTSPGIEVDVRDENYIWRKGRIVRTLNKINQQRMRVKYLVIQYQQNQKRQQFPSNSSRLAKYGSFTQNKKISQLQTTKKQRIKNIEQYQNPIKKIKKYTEIDNKKQYQQQYNQS